MRTFGGGVHPSASVAVGNSRTTSPVKGLVVA